MNMSSVLADGFQGAADVVASLSMALAFYEQGQLHQSSLNGELVVMQAFKDIRERVFGGRRGFDSIRGNGERSRGRAERKSPALGRALYARGQIPLADCSVLGRCDEGVTGQMRKSPALGRAHSEFFILACLPLKFSSRTSIDSSSSAAVPKLMLC